MEMASATQGPVVRVKWNEIINLIMNYTKLY